MKTGLNITGVKKGTTWRAAILTATLLALVPLVNKSVRAKTPPMPFAGALAVATPPSSPRFSGTDAAERRISLWRWRHGYYRSGDDWFWLSLGDEANPMEKADGLFFDLYLESLLGLWDKKGGAPRSAEGLVGEFGFDKASGGAPGARRVTCVFDAWGSTVVVRFNAEKGPDGVLRPAGRVRWTYTRSPWRETRGYQRKPLGGYRFDAQYPRHWGAAEGRRLDALMDRGIEYWSEVAMTASLERLAAGGRAESRTAGFSGKM